MPNHEQSGPWVLVLVLMADIVMLCELQIANQSQCLIVLFSQCGVLLKTFPKAF